MLAPSLSDLDRVFDAPDRAYRLTSQEVAEKLGAHGQPEQLRDFGYVSELLLSLGIGPGDFDLDLLPIIQDRAVEIATRRQVDGEVARKQVETFAAVAIGVLVAMALQTVPALAADWSFTDDVAPWGFCAALLVAVIWFVTGRFDWLDDYDPHAAGYDVEEWRR